MLYLNHIDLATKEDIDNGLVTWAEFFNADTWDELRSLVVKHPEFKEVAESMYYVDADTSARSVAEAHERYLEYWAVIQSEAEEAQKEVAQAQKEVARAEKEAAQAKKDAAQAKKDAAQTKKDAAQMKEQALQMIVHANQVEADAHRDVAQAERDKEEAQAELEQVHKENEKLRQRLIAAGISPDDN